MSSINSIDAMIDKYKIDKPTNRFKYKTDKNTK
jgi:hypothetical protein